MRLIDADAFKEAIGTDTKIREVLCEIIDTRPTAYDLESAMEQLKDKKAVFYSLVNADNEGSVLQYDLGRYDGIVKAIDIVRKAVLNE